jgi:hypothetical protein
MNYQEAAQWAIDCQDASNLSGVVHSFDKAVSAIWEEAHRTGKGTAWVNTHPIVTLYLSKLASLNRNYMECSDFGASLYACESIVKGLPEPFLHGEDGPGKSSTSTWAEKPMNPNG